MTQTKLIQDYQISTLANLINNCLNPKQQSGLIWARRYLSLHSVIYYFEYAAGMVQTQERALSEKLPDPIICGSAVSAYANMGACLKLLGKAISGFTHPEVLLATKHHLANIKRIEDIRNRITAHPYEEEKGTMGRKKFLVSKRSGYSSDGRVWIRQVSYDPTFHSRSKKFELTARVDLENLRNYLSELAEVLTKQWC